MFVERIGCSLPKSIVHDDVEQIRSLIDRSDARGERRLSTDLR
jgi:hypothetical protein